MSSSHVLFPLFKHDQISFFFQSSFGLGVSSATGVADSIVGASCTSDYLVVS